MKKILALILITIFSFAITIFSGVAYANEAEEDKIYKETVKVWNKCKSCHGKIQEGKATKLGKKLGAPENLFSELNRKEIEDLKKFIEDGEGKMPSFSKKLNDEQIELISKFIILINKMVKINKQDLQNKDDVKPILFIDYLNRKEL